VNTTTITPSPPATAARPAAAALAALRRYVGRWGLIAALLALPVYYAVSDLANGYQAGVLAGHPVIHHDLSRLGFNFAEGLSDGAIWALIAIGYTLVYGIIELINFAHGDVFMIGSFTAVGMWSVLGLSLTTSVLGVTGGLVVSLVIAMLTTGILNVLIEKVAYKPLRGAPKLAPLITAIGFSFILQNVGLLWRGGSPKSVTDLIGAQKVVTTIWGIPIQRGYLLAWVVTIPLVIALTIFITSTRAGKAMRATAQDPEAARLMGINVDTTISLTFLLGGLLAGAAGLIYAVYQTDAWFFQGFQAGLIAFTAAVMGGIGNLRGAVLGGLIIGFIQQISDNRIGATWTPVVVFAYLVLIMVFRPQGLLGEETREAG